MTLRKKIGRSKFGNIRTQSDGFTFDSKKEANRWGQLRLLERTGHIKYLKRQVAFPLIVNGQLIAKYKADFVYEEDGKRIVEDTKGFRTQLYLLKKKLMLACLGIEVMES